MLGRKYRASRKDIEAAIKSGAAVSFAVLYAKISRTDTEKAGFAIVVSKKTEKTSVGRHALKRKVSAAIEANIKKMGPNFKKTIVFFPKKTERPVPYAEIKKEVEEVLKKSRFYA